MTTSAPQPPHQIVVIGGGYAGALAANRLRQRDDVEITVINPRPTFVDRIRLHQYVAGTGEATTELGALLGEGIRLVVDSVTRIDTPLPDRSADVGPRGGLRLRDLRGRQHRQDSDPVPGATAYAISIAELESAQRLRARLDDLSPEAPITVVGAGLTGIETAAELVEQGRRVTLVCGRILAPALSAPARRSVAAWLSRHGVTVVEGQTVTEVRSDAVVLTEGSVHPSALTIWSAGFGVPELAAASGLRTDEFGRLITDETLTSVDDERIVAAGDAAAPSGRPLRMSCQAAAPLGARAAETVLSRIAGTEPAVLDLAIVGSCVSLGRHAAVRQFARKDDSSVNVYVGGRLAAAYKELTCKLGMIKLRREAGKPGSLTWFKRAPRSAASVAGPVSAPIPGAR